MPPAIVFLRPFKLAFAAVFCGALVSPSAGAQTDARPSTQTSTQTSAYAPKPSAVAYPGPNAATSAPDPAEAVRARFLYYPIPGQADQAQLPHHTTADDTRIRLVARSEDTASTNVPSSDLQKSLPLRVTSDGTNAGSQSQALHGDKRTRKKSLTSITTAVSGLAIVLGLFFLVAWLFKRGMPKAAAALPREVVETLGRTTLAPRQTVHLIRIGQKLLLVSISAAGVETLTEITDPLEVDRLAGICKQSAPSSASSAFRHVFQQFSHEPARAGFVGDGNPSDKELASRELVPEVTDV